MYDRYRLCNVETQLDQRHDFRSRVCAVHDKVCCYIAGFPKTGEVIFKKCTLVLCYSLCDVYVLVIISFEQAYYLAVQDSARGLWLLGYCVKHYVVTL